MKRPIMKSMKCFFHRLSSVWMRRYTRNNDINVLKNTTTKSLLKPQMQKKSTGRSRSNFLLILKDTTSSAISWPIKHARALIRTLKLSWTKLVDCAGRSENIRNSWNQMRKQKQQKLNQQRLSSLKTRRKANTELSILFKRLKYNLYRSGHICIG